MRSTGGVYFSRLDHVRALAIYLVFVWHFLHMTPQFPVPYASAPIFPFALLDEGHTGVALFMTLSGYLFAKLVGNQQLDFANFLYSRALRLAPLLLACLAAWWIIGWLTGDPIPVSELIAGLILPTWPKGAWSITIELHFYVLFPLLLFLCRRFGPGALLLVLAFAIAVRMQLWLSMGDVQFLSYWTIIGRIDQFLLGMIFALAPIHRSIHRFVATVSGVSFLILWQQFDAAGGYYNRTGVVSGSALWIVIPTVEAITFSSLISLYDRSSARLPAWLDRGLAKIGEWSYSMYLLHFFPIVLLRWLFSDAVGSPQYFFSALLVATVAFLAFLPVAALSYIRFEKGFLAHRRPYLLGQQQGKSSEGIAARSSAP
jgi:peptidoglycan/LPS O-acetylase OafA/YrhL